MYTRIVRMQFRPDAVAEFLAVFDEHKSAIGSFPGCAEVQLLKDVEHPACFCTISRWDHPDSLERYRTSELFSKVWKRIKPLFSEKTVAFTLTGI